jgi:hypothetical protein
MIRPLSRQWPLSPAEPQHCNSIDFAGLLALAPRNRSATAAATARDNATRPRNSGKEECRGCREGVIARLLYTRAWSGTPSGGPILGRDDRARLDMYPVGRLSFEHRGSQVTERLRADCADAPVFGFSAHCPSGSLATQKEDCPRHGEKPGGRVPAPKLLVPSGS